ncbi:MAG: anthranilate synthase component I [Bryobacteraceae bacterium]
MSELKYRSRSGVAVVRTTTKVPYSSGLSRLLSDLDRHRGFIFPLVTSIRAIFPLGYCLYLPPVEIVSFGREVEFRSLNNRGNVITCIFESILRQHPHWERFGFEGSVLRGTLKPLSGLFSEEERSKQPSVFSVLRALVQEFGNRKDSRLGLVGAFGYDLLFQFDPIEQKLSRSERKDLHLFLCDDIYFMDRKKEQIEHCRYDFTFHELSTLGMDRSTPHVPIHPPVTATEITSDHTPHQYMAKVESVREGMHRGDYYEVVLRQTFSANFGGSVSDLFKRIQLASPSPYEFLLQLGDEQLVGASPEMFVRVEGSRVETCPIAGTAKRTGDPLQDAISIRELLNSTKEESELTMCTDVDRNDKSRVCVPGSVKVIGRRLIEAYAGVFHTVDHVEGTLQPGFDSLDAFLAHMWAVTIIGAPKKAAAQAIEELESTARGWYGGAVGMLSLNGDINTGILIRTVHLRSGRAEYPVGATLLYDSVPELEEQETRLKATGFFRALRPPVTAPAPRTWQAASNPIRMLLVDNDDCFIHTLANYARQTGAEVVTYRAGFPPDLIERIAPDLILISPDRTSKGFRVPDVVHYAAGHEIPIRRLSRIAGDCRGLWRYLGRARLSDTR